MPDQQNLLALRTTLRGGPHSARELIKALRVSQPTLSRLLQSLGAQVARYRSGRTVHYALRRPVQGVPQLRIPLHRINPQGLPETVAQLSAWQNSSWQVETSDATLHRWLRPPFDQGIFPDLPWFFEDLRPQGFLGRLYVQEHGKSLGLDPDPRVWSGDDLIRSLLLHGSDLTGDWVVGDDALNQALHLPAAPIAEAEIPTHYTYTAEALLSGGAPGSSAGGEQPKLTACIERNGTPCHVLVKFSPLTDTPAGQRWADLLHAEHRALDLLRQHSIPAAETRTVDAGGRRFLEAVRFDRSGPYGRRSVISLSSFDAAYYGLATTPWTAAADRLEADAWLAPESAARMRQAGWFGELIGNTDMHYGNFSFQPGADYPLEPTPIYDMLPMLHAPTAGGEMPARTFTPRLPAPAHLPDWTLASTWALEYWEQLADDPAITEGFRALSRNHAATVHALRQRLLG